MEYKGSVCKGNIISSSIADLSSKRGETINNLQLIIVSEYH